MKNIFLILISIFLFKNVSAQKTLEENCDNFYIYPEMLKGSTFAKIEVGKTSVLYKFEKNNSVKKIIFSDSEFESIIINDVKYINNYIFVRCYAQKNKSSSKTILTQLDTNLNVIEEDVFLPNNENSTTVTSLESFKDFMGPIFKRGVGLDTYTTVPYIENKNDRIYNDHGNYYYYKEPKFESIRRRSFEKNSSSGTYVYSNPFEGFFRAPKNVKISDTSYISTEGTIKSWTINNYLVNIKKYKGNSQENITLVKREKNEDTWSKVANVRINLEGDELFFKGEQLGKNFFITLDSKTKIGTRKVSYNPCDNSSTPTGGPSIETNYTIMEGIAIINPNDNSIQMHKIELSSQDFSVNSSFIKYDENTETAYVSGTYFDNKTFFDKNNPEMYQVISGTFLMVVDLKSEKKRIFDHPLEKTVVYGLTKIPASVNSWGAHNIEANPLRIFCSNNEIKVLYEVINQATGSACEVDYMNGYFIETFDNDLIFKNCLYFPFKIPNNNNMETVSYDDFRQTCRNGVSLAFSKKAFDHNLYNYPSDSKIANIMTIGFMEASDDLSTIIYAYGKQLFSCKNGTIYKALDIPDPTHFKLFNARSIKINEEKYIIFYRENDAIKTIEYTF